MRMVSSRSIAVLLVLVLAATCARLDSQTVSILYSFNGQNSSGQPVYVAPMQGRNGRLYGTTYGPNGGFGSVFTITTTGTEAQIYTFGTDGANPEAGLTLGTDGNFYGTTTAGGSSGDGVLFLVSPAGGYTDLHDFGGGSDGAVPTAPPIEASDGNFYGSTSGTAGASTLYEYSPSSGTFSTILSLGSTQGQYVIGGVVEGSDGDLYGSAEEGGLNGCGTLFKVTKSGTFLWGYSFACSAGFLPGQLVLGTDGSFYGTTAQGGRSVSCGTVFKLSQADQVSIVYAFKGVLDGCEPFGGLAQGSDGNLYGATTFGGKGTNGGGGTLYSISSAGIHTVLYDFGPTGEEPTFPPAQDTNGEFYGTTEVGGHSGYGSVYSLNMGLAPFVAFVQPTGNVGRSAQILGQDLTGTTTVTFNGVPATSFTVKSDTFMTAIVPAGATTGPVVVTTPTGTLTSNVSFRVTQ